MNNFKYWKQILLVLILLPASLSAEGKRLPITVSLMPQKYFVERIGGKYVDVQVLVKPGSSPATYEPTPRQMAFLSESKLYFRIGVPFENAFIPKIRRSMKGIKIVDTRAGIKLRTMNKTEHEHDKHNGDDTSGKDPHIWLNPALVKVQIKTIADALSIADPEHKQIYTENRKLFAAELDKLNQTLAEVLAPVKGKTLMVFHPAWGYFADAYGLHQQAVEIEGKNPGARQLAHIIDQAKKEDVKVIFVQPQFSTALADKIAKSIGAAVVRIDPLAYNYISNMKKVAVAVQKALKKQN
jgi:zinc transport system substrate-binding protein